MGNRRPLRHFAPLLHRRGLALVVLLAGSRCLLASSAQAAADGQGTGPQRVALWRMEFEGSVPAAVRDLYSSRLIEGLVTARFEVYQGKMVEQRLASHAARLRGCREVTCYPEVARILAVSYLVNGHVSENSKTYTIGLEIINGRTGGVVASHRERCETCGIDEVGEKMALAASALRARLETLLREPSRIVLRTRPSGVFVRLDGHDLGQTPLDHDLTEGEHHITLFMSGYEPLDRTLNVMSGVDENLNFELVPVTSAVSLRAMGWGGVLVGSLAVVGGIWLLSKDGKEITCSRAAQDPQGHCPQIWNTKLPAVTAIGLGAAAASCGGILLYLGNGRSGPSAGDGTRLSLGIRGRF